MPVQETFPAKLGVCLPEEVREKLAVRLKAARRRNQKTTRNAVMVDTLRAGLGRGSK
jgi:hypothetical protein